MPDNLQVPAPNDHGVVLVTAVGQFSELVQGTDCGGRDGFLAHVALLDVRMQAPAKASTLQGFSFRLLGGAKQDRTRLYRGFEFADGLVSGVPGPDWYYQVRGLLKLGSMRIKAAGAVGILRSLF